MRLDVNIREVKKGSHFTPYGDAADVSTLSQLKHWVEEFRLMHIGFARDIRKEKIADGTLAKSHVTFVDKTRDKPEKAVQSFGVIEYLHPESQVNALIEIFDDVVARSPRSTGDYLSSHLLLWNGFLVARTSTEVKSWLKDEHGKIKAGDKFRIINVIAYARRLELEGVRNGATKKKTGKASDKKKAGLMVRKPNGAYHLTWRKYSAKYRWMFTRFRFEFLPGAHINSSLLRGKRTTFKKDGRPYLYPSIEIIFDAKNTFGGIK